MPTFTNEEKELIKSCHAKFKNKFEQNLEKILITEINYYSRPPEIDKIFQDLNKLDGEINKELTDDIQLSDSLNPLIKLIIMSQRYNEASALQESSEKTFRNDLLRDKRKRLDLFDGIMKQKWVKETKTYQLPKLIDFISPQRAEELFKSQYNLQLSHREFHHKFQTLLAAKLFLPDLNYHKQICSIRNNKIAVAYIDIDNFKSFNTKYSEPIVDKIIIPRFIQTIEAHIHGHGSAYQEGGDEYLIILPNTSEKYTIDILNELRSKLESIDYPGVSEKTTISVGVCIIDPDCFFTNQEIKEKANKAKTFAKAKGKNRIATYKDLFYEEPYIITPAQPTLITESIQS